MPAPTTGPAAPRKLSAATMHGSSSNTVELLAHCSTAKPPRLNDRGGPALSPRRGNRRWLQFATIVVIVTIAGVLTTGGTQEGGPTSRVRWEVVGGERRRQLPTRPPTRRLPAHA